MPQRICARARFRFPDVRCLRQFSNNQASSYNKEERCAGLRKVRGTEEEAEMGVDKFRRIAVVVNPAAKNGEGEQAAWRVTSLLERAVGADAFDVMLTQGPGHAVDLVASLSPAYGTVVTVGGDGLIHEVANGLMRQLPQNRAQLGVVPVGSGNDYAATLGMSSKIDRAVDQILDCNAAWADVGRVSGQHVAGEYFVETLSFGLDAAIALDTVERRRRTGRTGTILYLESGIDQLFHHLDATGYEVEVISALAPDSSPASHGTPASSSSGEGVSEGAADLLRSSGRSYLFAVQLGPTYGGRFKVCPQARIDDGLFDVCIAHPPLGVFSATGIFLLAKGGHHTGFRQIEMFRARGLRVTFDAEPAAQMDGEKLTGTSFSVEMVPHAFKVLKGAAS